MIMLSVTMRSVDMLTAFMACFIELSVDMLSIVMRVSFYLLSLRCSYAEYRNVKCRYTYCHYASLIMLCRYSENLYPGYHNTECRNAN
jgi:hypothetical protein